MKSALSNKILAQRPEIVSHPDPDALKHLEFSPESDVGLSQSSGQNISSDAG